MERRDFLKSIIAAATAPAFIKTAGLLMPIKPLIVIPDMEPAWPVQDWNKVHVLRTEVWLLAA